MKRQILTLLMFCIAVTGYAQWQPVNGPGQSHKKLGVDSIFRIPRDTLTTAPNGSLASINNKPFIKDTTWKPIMQAAGVTSFNGRIGNVFPGFADYTVAMVQGLPDTLASYVNSVGYGLIKNGRLVKADTISMATVAYALYLHNLQNNTIKDSLQGYINNAGSGLYKQGRTLNLGGNLTEDLYLNGNGNDMFIANKISGSTNGGYISLSHGNGGFYGAKNGSNLFNGLYATATGTAELWASDYPRATITYNEFNIVNRLKLDRVTSFPTNPTTGAFIYPNASDLPYWKNATWNRQLATTNYVDSIGNTFARLAGNNVFTGSNNFNSLGTNELRLTTGGGSAGYFTFNYNVTLPSTDVILYRGVTNNFVHYKQGKLAISNIVASGSAASKYLTTDANGIVVSRTAAQVKSDIGATSENFANTDLTFTGDRVHNAKEHTILIDSVGGFNVFTGGDGDRRYGVLGITQNGEYGSFYFQGNDLSGIYGARYASISANVEDGVDLRTVGQSGSNTSSNITVTPSIISLYTYDNSALSYVNMSFEEINIHSAGAAIISSNGGGTIIQEQTGDADIVIQNNLTGSNVSVFGDGGVCVSAAINNILIVANSDVNITANTGGIYLSQNNSGNYITVGTNGDIDMGSNSGLPFTIRNNNMPSFVADLATTHTVKFGDVADASYGTWLGLDDANQRLIASANLVITGLDASATNSYIPIYINGSLYYIPIYQ